MKVIVEIFGWIWCVGNEMNFEEFEFVFLCMRIYYVYFRKVLKVLCVYSIVCKVRGLYGIEVFNSWVI